LVDSRNPGGRDSDRLGSVFEGGGRVASAMEGQGRKPAMRVERSENLDALLRYQQSRAQISSKIKAGSGNRRPDSKEFA